MTDKKTIFGFHSKLRKPHPLGTNELCLMADSMSMELTEMKTGYHLLPLCKHYSILLLNILKNITDAFFFKLLVQTETAVMVLQD